MMVYGELGVVPLDVDIKLRMLTYGARVCLVDKHCRSTGRKSSSAIYSLPKKPEISLSHWIYC